MFGGQGELIMIRLPIDKINQHKQLFQNSCIPSAVEFVLKQLGRVNTEYYSLQSKWGDRKDGNFADFDGKELYGIKFRRCFGQTRNSNFPLKDLFTTISEELNAGHFVIISLYSPTSWHIYVIYEETDNTFKAVSKGGADGTDTIEEHNVKTRVIEMQGTDLLLYSIIEEKSNFK